MTYAVSKNNACWPVPVGALMQDTAGTGLFARKRYMRAMGDIPASSFSMIDGVAVANDSATKGVFIDLQNQTNRLCAYYGLGDLMLKPDGIIGPNTNAAVSAVAGMLNQGLEPLTADSATIAGYADRLAGLFESQAVVFGAPSVSAPATVRQGGGNAAAPPGPNASAQNQKVKTGLFAMFSGIDLTDPTTLATVAAAGVLGWALTRGKKRGGGRRRKAKGRARRRAPKRRGRR